MVPSLKPMAKWNKSLEEEITLLIKDWLKQKKKTQKDLKRVLNANSERMPVLIETLKSEYSLGGLPQLLSVLCAIEESWANNNELKKSERVLADPFDQLDLLLEELKDDCNT